MPVFRHHEAEWALAFPVYPGNDVFAVTKLAGHFALPIVQAVIVDL